MTARSPGPPVRPGGVGPGADPYPGPTFEYAARDGTGRLVTGSVAAESQTAVVTHLKALGYAPVTIARARPQRPARGAPGWLRAPRWRRARRVRAAETALWCRQLAALLDAGVGLPAALLLLEEARPARPLARALAAARAGPRHGPRVAAALGAQPRAFPAWLTAAIAAGEAGAVLDLVLPVVAETCEVDARLSTLAEGTARRPLRLALLAVLVLAGGGVLLVRPVLATLRSRDAGLSGTAYVLLAAGALVGLLLALTALSAQALLRRSARLDGARDGARLWALARRLPGLGELARALVVVRFAAQMRCVLRCGVPLLHGLAAVAEACPAALGPAVAAMADNVRRGQPLGAGEVDTTVVPPVYLALLRRPLPGADSSRYFDALHDVLGVLGDLAEREALRLAAPVRAVLTGLLLAGLVLLAGCALGLLYLPLPALIGLLR